MSEKASYLSEPSPVTLSEAKGLGDMTLTPTCQSPLSRLRERGRGRGPKGDVT